MVDSHIQIPKQIFKNFTNKDNQLFYYDFAIGRVKLGHPKSLYTERGYYSDEVERFLSTEIEDGLGDINKFLRRTTFEDTSGFPKNYREIAFKYLYSLIARSPSLQKAINSNSIYYQFYPETDRHDFAAYNCLNMLEESNLMKYYSVSFLDNMTEEEFVLPTGGAIQYENNLICPITPTKAIYFDINKSSFEDEKIIVGVFPVEDPDFIRLLNIMSFQQEYERDRKYVVASSRGQLESLVNLFNRLTDFADNS